MSEQWPDPSSQVTILSALGSELERASERAHAGRWPGRVIAVALVAGLTIAGGAMAATGVLPIGATIRGGEASGPPENRMSVGQTVVAQGTAAVAGPWRITSYNSAGVVDDGDVLEPRGLPCIELSLTSPPPVTPLLGSSFCGADIQKSFTPSRVAATDGEEAVLILFGSAPESASGVTLLADGTRRLAAQMFDGPDDYPGDLWAIAVRPGLRTAKVQWTREDGSAGGPARDVSDSLDHLDSVSRFRP